MVFLDIFNTIFLGNIKVNIPRLCTPDKEALILEVALCNSAAQVETIVKRYRTVDLKLDAHHAFHQYEAKCLATYWEE